MSTVKKMSNDNLEFDEWINDSMLSMQDVESQNQIDTNWLTMLDNDLQFFTSNDEYSNIMEYFSNLDSELTILMLHPKVVQKSYQNEKRFMAPQPLIYFIGNGWPIEHSEVSIKFNDSVKNRSSYTGQVVKENDRVDLMTETSYLRSFKNKVNYYKASFKSLYVSETDKLKSVHLALNLEFGSQEGKSCLSFLSNEIKIISKPSKKKFLAKANDCKFYNDFT
jgi:hypothetical protein